MLKLYVLPYVWIKFGNILNSLKISHLYTKSNTGWITLTNLYFIGDEVSTYKISAEHQTFAEGLPVILFIYRLYIYILRRLEYIINIANNSKTMNIVLVMCPLTFWLSLIRFFILIWNEVLLDCITTQNQTLIRTKKCTKKLTCIIYCII